MPDVIQSFVLRPRSTERSSHRFLLFLDCEFIIVNAVEYGIKLYGL